MYGVEFATLMLLFALAVITPGADFAMVVRQALVYGRAHAVVTAFGIGTALMVHVSYTVLGLGLIISKSPLFFNLIKWAGVAYLVYIGVRAIAAKGSLVPVHGVPVAGRSVEAAHSQSARRAFMLGFGVNVLNPKAVFFFLSIFSSFVAVTTPALVKFGYGLGMSVFVITWFSAVGFFLSTLAVRQFFGRVSHWIERTSGAVFIGLGIRLMFQKAS